MQTIVLQNSDIPWRLQILKYNGDHATIQAIVLQHNGATIDTTKNMVTMQPFKPLCYITMVQP